MTLRTKKTEEAYNQAKIDGKLTPLRHLPSIKNFKYWRLVNNDFPHDKETITHHMLVPIRVVPEFGQITLEEFFELYLLENEILAGDYDAFKRNTNRQRSVFDHYHIHCLVYKQD